MSHRVILGEHDRQSSSEPLQVKTIARVSNTTKRTKVLFVYTHLGTYFWIRAWICFFFFSVDMSCRLWTSIFVTYLLLIILPSRPSLTPTTTPRTSTMTSHFWSCLPQYRWQTVCLLCAWPPPAPTSLLEPNVSLLDGARLAKPVSEQLP